MDLTLDDKLATLRFGKLLLEMVCAQDDRAALPAAMAAFPKVSGGGSTSWHVTPWQAAHERAVGQADLAHGVLAPVAASSVAFTQPDVPGDLRTVSGPEEVAELARVSAARVKSVL